MATLSQAVGINFIVLLKVQRLEGEDIETNNPSTSAHHLNKLSCR